MTVFCFIFVFQETDLSNVLQALKTQNEIQSVLSNSIPSATQVVNDAERISSVLHQNCVHHEAPQERVAARSNLINLMTNITRELEDYPGSGVGAALHAARQVAYWFSVFISMASDKDANQTTLSIPTAPSIPSGVNQPNLATPQTASAASPNNQSTASRHPAASIQH